MGWRDGRGLGANEDGISSALQVSFRQVDDKRGVHLCSILMQLLSLFSCIMHLPVLALISHAFVASLFRLGIGANGLGADVALEGIRTYDQILRNLTEFNSNSRAGAGAASTSTSDSNPAVSSSDASAAAADGANAPERKHKRHSRSHKHKRATDSGLEPGSLAHATVDTNTLPEASAEPSATDTVSCAVELEPAEQQLPTFASSPSLCSFSAASEGSSSASSSPVPSPGSGSPSSPALVISHPHAHSSLSSLCERARRSRTLRFSKVVRGKDLSTRSARELLGVLGLAAYPTAVAEPVVANASAAAAAAASASASACASGTETTPTPVPVADEGAAKVKANALVSLVPTYTSGVSVADYFKRLAEKRKLASAPLPPLPHQLFESEYG